MAPLTLAELQPNSRYELSADAREIPKRPLELGVTEVPVPPPLNIVKEKEKEKE